MLLDVNVLLALAWPNHQFHVAAREWFGASLSATWATCALTELAFVRLSSHTSFTPDAKRPAEAAAHLAEMRRHGRHRFLAELPSVVEGLPWTTVAGPKQVTDVYLVHVAQQNATRLATFDARLRSHRALADAILVIG